MNIYCASASYYQADKCITVLLLFLSLLLLLLLLFI